jgi:hypothetical protein
MAENITVDKSFVEKVPLSLVRLYNMACNNENRLDRHLAAYCVWDATLTLILSDAAGIDASGQKHRTAIGKALIPRRRATRSGMLFLCLNPVAAKDLIADAFGELTRSSSRGPSRDRASTNVPTKSPTGRPY